MTRNIFSKKLNGQTIFKEINPLQWKTKPRTRPIFEAKIDIFGKKFED